MWNKPFKFTSEKSEKIRISLLVTVILVFILFFLKPFDMVSYVPHEKWYLYIGYGVSLFISHLIIIVIEDKIYLKQHKKWYLKNEIFIKTLYFLIGSVFIYFYHFLFVKTFQHPWTSFPVFVINYTFPFFMMFLPLMVFYRKLKGHYYKETDVKINFTGNNKNENFFIKRNDILYARSENNYVFVHYLDDELEKRIMLRNTLSNIHHQAPFLVKSHRSFLINPQRFTTLKGNSQNAWLKLSSCEEKIPVSKTYYSQIKELQI